MDLKERMKTAVLAAKAIATKAESENRDLTADELKIADSHIAEYKALKKEYESEEVKQKLADIGIDLGLEGGPARTKAHTLGQSSKHRSAKAWGSTVERKIRDRVGNFGAKALINGTIDIPSVITPEPVLVAGRPTTLLDLIPRRPRPAANGDPRSTDNQGNTYSWLEQTVRDLNAGSVPDGAHKPVSGVTFADKEDRYRVYATLTDPIPKRYLDDYSQLIQILQTQLGEGLFEQLEYDILNGSGVTIAEVMTSGAVTTQGEDPVKGILQTSGIQVQAYASNILQTLSNARYKLEDSRATPNAWVLNSADLQALELLRESGSTGAFMFSSGRSEIEKVLGDYPIVTSSLITAGSALLGDFTKTELIIREDDHLDVDGSGELFDRNQVKFRHEGRYGFAVLKPSSFISVDLTA